MSAKLALLAVSIAIGMGVSANALSAGPATTEAQPDCVTNPTHPSCAPPKKVKPKPK